MPDQTAPLSKAARTMLLVLTRFERFGNGSADDGDYFDTETPGNKRTLQYLAKRGLVVAWVDPHDSSRMFGALPAEGGVAQ